MTRHTPRHLVLAAVLGAGLAACGAESESAPPTSGPAGSDASSTVARLYHDASLTTGIPGSGDLSAAEIRAWLDDPVVHQTLTVELPLGLNVGKGQEKGLDANPMTRAKIELGRQLYFDKRLSADGTISCATCHH